MSERFSTIKVEIPVSRKRYKDFHAESPPPNNDKCSPVFDEPLCGKFKNRREALFTNFPKLRF